MSDHFAVPPDQHGEAEVDVQSAEETVVTVRLAGNGLTAVVVVTPVNEGETSAAVSVTTSAGSATQTVPVSVGPPPAEPPRVIGNPPRLELVAGGAGRDVPVGEYFAVDPRHTDVAEVEIVVNNEAVVSARLRGTGLMSVMTVEPVGPGSTFIEVIVRTPAGDTSYGIPIRVLPAATDPPRVVGEPEPLTLVTGGSSRNVHLRGFLTTGTTWEQDRATEVEVRPENERVATARLVGEGGLVGELIVAPVGAGETTVVVIAWNRAGSATLRIPVTVVPAEPPRLAKPIRRLTFVLGAQGQDVRFDDAFAPPGALLEAGSLDESVVVATPHDLYAERVVFEPVGPGETVVVVTARNAAGEAALMVSLTVIEKLRIGLVTRLGSAGAPPVPLEEGGHWNIEVRPLEEGAFREPWDAPVTFRIGTDAPAEELRVPESITAYELVSRWREKAVTPVEALSDDIMGERDATYEVFLISAEGLAPWMELSTDPVRVTVVDSRAAGCEDLWVDASLDRRTGEMREGTFRIHGPAAAQVSWTGPYVSIVRGPTPLPTVATHVFPERLPFRDVRDGFEREFRLLWWDGDLRSTVEAPGCEPVEIHCDRFTCDVR